MENELLYLNGEFMPLKDGRVGIEDRGFQLGDGVYEVIRVMNGRLVWLEDHLERLERSLAAIRLSGALAGHQLDRVLPELVARAEVGEGMVYIQVTRGAARREFVFPHPPHPTVLAYVRDRALPTPAEVMAGTILHPVEDLRWARCDIKSVDLLAAVLAKEEAKEAGAQEALFLGPGGVVREGGSSNVFAVIDGVLRTHPLDNHILGGITRRHVLVIARRLGVSAEERSFILEELVGGSREETEVFTASTIKGVMPVLRIGRWVIGGGRPGPVTRSILEAIGDEQALLVGLPAPPASA